MTANRPIANFEDTPETPAGHNSPAANGHRPPPHDLNLEAGLLGAVLVRPETTLEHLARARHTFYRPAHTHISDAILALADREAAIDLATVAHQLEATGLLDTIGGPAALTALQAEAPYTAAARTYADELLDLHRRRRILTAGLELAETARGGTDPARILERLTDEIAHEAPTSWQPIDLAAVIAGGELTQPPTILHRDDGQALIYPGKVHAFNAESESGKSWLALWACLEQLALDQHVVYLDFEDGAEGVTGRLLALGVDADLITRRFHYIRPDDPIDPAALAALDQILTLNPTLTVIDGVTEAMVTNNWSINDNDDIARFLATLPRRIARTGSAVILIDHVVKAKQEQGDYGIGGQHKRAGIDGAAYKLEVVKTFGRGLAGIARITCTKDRPGHIRPGCAAGKTVGELHLNSTGDTALINITAPKGVADPDSAFRPTHLMERLSRCVEDSNEAGVKPSSRQILQTTKGNRDALLTALRTLIEDGHITTESGARNTLHHIAANPYRESDDPRSDRYQPPEEPAPYDPNEEF